jgi:hypothetical protein
MKLVIKTSQAVEDALGEAAPTQPIPQPKRSFAESLTRRIPSEIVLVLTMFLVTRAILTFIGMASRSILQPLLAAWPTDHLWLNIWGGAETRWYLDIVRHGYPANAIDSVHGAGTTFFPAYPLLVKALDFAIGNPYIAGLVLSNLCLLVAGYGLYKLTFIDADVQIALGAVKYLFLFPTAFLFSGFASESLFLALLVGCFFFARRGIWLGAGVAGFVLALTSPLGLIVMIPLVLDYLMQARWSPARIGADILPLLLIPLGTLAFAGYTYYLFGDPLALFQIYMRWYGQLTNPLDVIINGLTLGDTFRAPVLFARVGAAFAVAGVVLLLLLLVAFKRVGLAYWALGMCLMVVPLATGAPALPLMARVVLGVFPLYIMLGTIATTSPTVDLIMTAGLALLQGFLMAFWTTGTGLVG